MTATLKSISPIVNFVHGDGKPAETAQLCVRLFEGKLVVARKGRLLPVTVKGANLVECNLAAKPLAEGLHEKGAAQAIAPVVNRERLASVQGAVAEVPTPPKAAKGRGKAKAASAAPEADMDALRQAAKAALAGMSHDAKIEFLATLLA